MPPGLKASTMANLMKCTCELMGGR